MKKLRIDEMDRLSTDEFKSHKKKPIVIVLDNVRSMNNVGSIFRTADAFLLECLYLCGITATPPQKDIHKTALGAEESVDWAYFEETQEAIANLRERGFQIFCLEQAHGSFPLSEIGDHLNPHKPVAIVVGHEVHGVDQAVVDASDGCVEIPQFGTKHSLNVSVSTGMLVWQLFLTLG